MEFKMDVKNIMKLSDAEEFLKNVSPKENVLDLIQSIIHSWGFQSVDNLELIRSDLNILIATIKKKIFQQNLEENLIERALHCIVFTELYDDLMLVIKEMWKTEDLCLYDKCTSLCRINISPSQLGSQENYAMKFSAAIVELSVLDSYKSPQEKINCLCTTYDLLFAELKATLVSMISKYSDKENDIPIVENEDVIPVLMVVIIKSKLFYLISNLKYIKHFAIKIMRENSTISSIFQKFEVAVLKLQNTDVKFLLPDSNKLETSLGICETMQFVSITESFTAEKPTTLQEEKHRIATLIATSTTENTTTNTNSKK